MKKLIITLLSFVLIVGYISPLHAQKKKTETHQTYVYLCNSRTAYVYHSSSNCRGLNRCSHGLIKVMLSDAKKVYGRRACKICE